MDVSPLQRHVNASDIQPERLAGNTELSQSDKIAEASRQFESILLKQILDSSQKTVIKSKYSDDSASSSIYHDMVTNHLADSISKSGGLGIAKTFEQQLDRPKHGAASMMKDKAGDKTTAVSAQPAHGLHTTHVAHAGRPMHAKAAIAQARNLTESFHRGSMDSTDTTRNFTPSHVKRT
ncbi:MAG TPA: rod-binding protein [Verrucomicrobiae bacterium]|jgi:Rod binding domain-containing protein|nr:rod-binding protein [Verrucomicrobiae bacterium]